MLPSAVKSLVYQRLSFRRPSATLDAAIFNAMNEVKFTLERGGKSLPNWLIEEDSVLAGTGGDAVIALPDSFIREVEDEPLYLLDSDGNKIQELERGEYNQLKTSTPYWSGTAPAAYARRNTSIVVFPVPSEDFSLSWTYYKADTDFDSASDVANKWLTNFPYLIVASAGLIVAADLQDAAATAKFQSMANTQLAAYNTAIVEDEIAGRTYIMGGDQ